MVCVCHIPVFYIVYYTICKQACQVRKKLRPISWAKQYFYIFEYPKSCLNRHIDLIYPFIFQKSVDKPFVWLVI